MVLLCVLCALYGLIIGSFLNVVIWRVPRGESVVRPASACPQCGTTIRAKDNIPVLSWLLLRGRCRDCGNPISARYPLVEGLTAVLFALTAWHFGTDWALPAYLYLVAVGVALALIDLDTRRLPNALTLPSYPVALVLLGVAALADGEWHSLLRAVICAAIAFVFFFVLWYFGGMGYGDVRFSGVLGLYLGWLSYGILATGLFLGFFLGAVVSVALVAFAGAGRKTKVPFGPFMIAGAYLAVLVGQQLVDAYVAVSLS